jgi:hypothetical protein
MPRGDKSKYTDKQERKADHIAESYESRGVPEKEAERRAWATVNKERRRQEERVGAGQAGKPCLIAQRRKAWRQSVGFPFCSRALGLGKEGGGNAQTQRQASSLDITGTKCRCCYGITAVVHAKEAVRKSTITWSGVVRPSRRPLCGLLRMRTVP